MLFEFEWNEEKAESNQKKHGIAFELACSVFQDARLLTVPDLEHGIGEERWFSIGHAQNGVAVAVAYVWKPSDEQSVKIRIISARKATRRELQQYWEEA